MSLGMITPPPPALGAKTISYTSCPLLVIHGFYGRDGRKNFRGGSSDWKSEVLVPFLRVKSDQRATNPHPPPLFIETTLWKSQPTFKWVPEEI